MATETAIDVVMPQMGVSVSEGTITRWLKQEGEHVEADEPLLEISTDKVDTEVPSPASGTLTQILVQEGADGRRRDEARPDRRSGGAARAAPAARRGDRRLPRRAAPDTAPRLRASPRRSRAAGVERRQRHRLHLAGRRADRVRAQRRPVARRGHRPRRPRDEEGHPRLHRAGRPGPGARAAAGSAAESPPSRRSPRRPPRPRRHRPRHRSRSRRHPRHRHRRPRLRRPSRPSRRPRCSPARRSSRCRRCAAESRSTCAARSTPRRTSRARSRSTCRGSSLRASI